MAEKQWVAQYGIYSYAEIPQIYEKLPPAVYELQYDVFRKIFVLERLFDRFELPEVIYDLEDALIKRVITTYKGYNKNFGMLLKGIKGTGKTVVAKMICNELKLPVILITKPWNDIGNFINSIQQDVILLFDEFEKTYQFYENFNPEERVENQDNPAGQNNISNLLTLMDGVFTSTYKRLFLLTTNREYMPDALLARPSRIRYIKEFQDLSLDAIKQILDDTVTNKTLIPDLLNLLKNLEIITVDIVKAIAEEANLYNTADPKFYEIFNVKHIERRYDFLEVNGDTEKLVIENAVFDEANFRIGYHIYTEYNEYVYTITKYIPEQHVVIVYNQQDPDHNPKKPKEITLRYRRSVRPHRAFIYE